MASRKKIKSYVLIGFQTGGKCNVICITCAESDYAAATKLGGTLVKSTHIGMDFMEIYASRLLPSSKGVVRGEFRFTSNTVVESLTKRERSGKWINSAKNVVERADYLVLAEVPFVE